MPFRFLFAGYHLTIVIAQTQQHLKVKVMAAVPRVFLWKALGAGFWGREYQDMVIAVLGFSLSGRTPHILVDIPAFSMPESKFFLIQSQLNELVLDIQGNTLEAGTPVTTWEQHGGDNQLWYLDSVRNVIRSKADDNLVLEIQGDQLVVSEYNPDEVNQQFLLEDNKVRCADCPDHVLDIAECNSEPGANICRYEYHESDNQHWNFVHIDPVYAFIRSVSKEDRVLDVKGDDDDEGTRIILYHQKDEDNDNQLWYEDRNGFIRNKETDFVFDTYDDDKLRVREFDADVETQRWVKSGNKIVSKDDPDKCLQVKECGFMSKDKVEVGDFSGDEGQRWTFAYV